MKTQILTVDPSQPIEVSKTGGDLAIRGWDKAEVEARGDGPQVEQAEGVVRASSRGDLTLSVPKGAHLEVSTVGGDVLVEELDGPVSLSIVGGDVLLRNLTGVVTLKGPVGGDTRLENVANVSMASGGAGFSRSFTAQHERRVEEKLRQAERKMERARARTGIDPGRWPWRRSGGPPVGGEADARVSDEERMMILRMLQDKKITSAEADSLLTALEGGQAAAAAGAPPSDEAGS